MSRVVRPAQMRRKCIMVVVCCCLVLFTFVSLSVKQVKTLDAGSITIDFAGFTNIAGRGRFPRFLVQNSNGYSVRMCNDWVEIDGRISRWPRITIVGLPSLGSTRPLQAHERAELYMVEPGASTNAWRFVGKFGRYGIRERAVDYLRRYALPTKVWHLDLVAGAHLPGATNLATIRSDWITRQ